MRNVVALLILSLLIGTLSASCSLIPHTLVVSEDATADEKLEQLVTALDSKDKDAITALFSEQALKDSENIEAGADYLLNLVRGEIVDKGDVTWGSSESVRDGRVIRNIYAWCNLLTTEQDYRIFMLIYDKDGNNPSNIGLYSLRIVAYDYNYTKHMTAWQDMQQPGIYAPTEQEVSEMGMNKTFEFAAYLAFKSPEEMIMPFRYYNSFEDMRGSFWFEMDYACIVYSGGVPFAIVDVGLYPDYTESGSGVIHTSNGSVAIEVLNNPNDNQLYSLLYEPDKKPSEEIINTFMMTSDQFSFTRKQQEGNLRDFYFRINDEVVTEYEFMSQEMSGVNRGLEVSQQTALLYKRINGVLEEGYPLEVSKSVYTRFDELADEYELKEWVGEYITDDMKGKCKYFLALQYQEFFYYASGVTDAPEDFDKVCEDLASIFDELEQTYR